MGQNVHGLNIKHGYEYIGKQLAESLQFQARIAQTPRSQGNINIGQQQRPLQPEKYSAPTLFALNL